MQLWNRSYYINAALFSGNYRVFSFGNKIIYLGEAISIMWKF